MILEKGAIQKEFAELKTEHLALMERIRVLQDRMFKVWQADPTLANMKPNGGRSGWADEDLQAIYDGCSDMLGFKTIRSSITLLGTVTLPQIQR